MIRRQGPILTLMACALVMLGAVVGAAPVGAAMLVNPVAEAQKLRVSQEREAQFDSPSMLAQLAAATSAYQKQRLVLAVTDPGRQPNPNSSTPANPRPSYGASGDHQSVDQLVSQVIGRTRVPQTG